MSDFRLNQACPKCYTNKLLYFDRNTIVCDDEQCHFRISYACPLCDSALEQETKTDDYGHYNRCTKCQNKIHWRRIKYLIETRLLVDQSTRCRICNGPTIHRASANMGHRCFFFPKCSGQTDLFNDSKETIVFLDFETTGLDSTRDHIIEIGALKIDEEGFEHVFEAFVKPPVPISEKITAITKITNEMVETAASIDHVLPQFLDFIHDSRLVAHNAEFDVPWLCVNAHRLNRATVIKDVLCTMKWAKQAKGSSRLMWSRSPLTTTSSRPSSVSLGRTTRRRLLSAAAAAAAAAGLGPNGAPIDCTDCTMAMARAMASRAPRSWKLRPHLVNLEIGRCAQFTLAARRR